MSSDPSTYRELAERAWAWVLTQVREGDEGVWLTEHPGQTEPGEHGMHSGVGGLAHMLEEIRLTRPLAAAEHALAEAIGETMVRRIPDETGYDYFDGLTSTIGVLIALDAPGVELAVARLQDLATPDGWPAPWIGPPRASPDARCNDATLGTAAVLLGALWALRHGLAGAAELADHAVDILLAEQEPREDGTYWPFVPLRFLLTGDDVQMPNWSHGQAGIAGALAVAGAELDRPNLVEAAMSGAEHLVTLADTSREGFVAPMTVPDKPGQDPVTFTWCHGPTGTSLLFAALDHAGATDIAGEPPAVWHRRCLHSVRTSGLPERLRPGFWDNDGRCCGTAGVAEVFLDSWQRTGEPDDLAFALHLADTLVERAVLDGPHAYWRFLEHRAPEPLLPPGVGWMQGAAGIAAYLMRLARVLREGRTTPTVARLDTWWNLP